MSVSAPYTSNGLGGSGEAPYQVQMFPSLQEPPACQDYRTYKEAVKRISELIVDPVCPITGKRLKAINLAQWVEPLVLVAVTIKEENGLKGLKIDSG